MNGNSGTYPVNLSVDYPDRELNKLTTFFRILTIIPIMIVLSLLGGFSLQWQENLGRYSYEFATAAVPFFSILLMILFQQKYPRWWFDWNVALTKFSARVWAYLALLRDEYPSTDEEQSVHIEIPYPDVRKDLTHWYPLVKWFLAIPHYIVLAFLSIAAVVCVIIAWFAILFTGRYPRELFDFVVGVYRWALRVSVYAFMLTTDQYPPFSLND